MRKKTQQFQNCLGVFQGGGCRGSAFVGAYKEAFSRGVSFSELVGTSVGSIITSFIAAGATPDELEKIIRQLDFSKLKSKPKKIENLRSNKFVILVKFYSKGLYNVMTKLGLYDSAPLQKWVDDELKKILGLSHSVKFKDLKIPTTIIVSDLRSRSIKLYGNLYNDDDYVAEAVRLSCNMPIYYQPIDKRFVDGGLLSNLPSFVYKNKQESSYERVLAFGLYNNSNEEFKMESIKDYLSHLAETSIDGSLNIQMALQKNVHLISIDTGAIKATDFNKMTEEVIDELILSGQKFTKDFFDNEIANIKSQNLRSDIYYDYFKAYNEISNSLTSKVSEVIVSDINTDWVYDLFPSILRWVKDGSEITILVKKNNDDSHHGPFRKRLLVSFGCNFKELDDLPFRGFIVNGNKIQNNPLALVFNEDLSKEIVYHSKLYYGEEDFKVISLLRYRCLENCAFKFEKHHLLLTKIDDDLLIEKLKDVKQYNNSSVSFKIMEVDLNELIFLTRYIRGFKFRQIDQIFNLFQEQNIPQFVPSCIKFPNGKCSLVAPPVLEMIGENLYVIEGNTRLTYAYKNGISKINCVIISNVRDPLPSSGRYKVQEMLITDKEKIGSSRYDNFNYSNFRKIESAVRNSSTTLI